jgi:hypothetical protein
VDYVLDEYTQQISRKKICFINFSV